MNLMEEGTVTGKRSEGVARLLLEAVVAGRYPAGSRLPTEPALCEEMGVSRSTVREAVASLSQRGVLSVEQGRGTFVTGQDRWSPLDPVLLAARTSVAGGPDHDWGTKLLEVRRMVEVGVAGLAASRRSQADLDAMQEEIDVMRDARKAGDVARFAEADLRFHEAVMTAAGNELLAALFDPISRLVHQGRLATSRTDDRRAHALRAHRAIHRAVAVGDSDAASRAMRRHIDNTLAFVATGPPGGTDRIEVDR